MISLKQQVRTTPVERNRILKNPLSPASMATSLMISSHLNLCLHSHFTSKHLFLSNPFANPPISLSPQRSNLLKFNHFPRASSEGLPVELVEDSKFVPLNADDDEKFGPPALLFLGFEVEEVAKVQQLLKDLDGEFLQIILCTEEMVTGTLWQAMNTTQKQNPDAAKIAKSVPRICFLSGLTGEEMMVLIDAFPESGLVPPVFAALVPNSADKTIQELIEEVMGDHEMLSARNSA